MNITLLTYVTKGTLEIQQKDMFINLIDLINKTIVISETNIIQYGTITESLIDIQDTTPSEIIYIT